MLWVGVDIGGTFTDVIAYDVVARRLTAAKSLSSPAEPVRAVLEGLRKLGVELARVERFVHGTTRVTNALLERDVAPVALVTTQGFRDVVEMGRGHRPRLYSVKERPPPRLVERTLRFEVPERLLADGSIHVPLDEARTISVLGEIAAAGVSGIAVCFLHSFRNAVHERRVAELAALHCPGLACSISSEIVPEIGEYERFATTVLNVSVKPVVEDYLARFEGALRAEGFRGGLSIMTSSGGIVSAEQARRVPMQLALSGPAGGVAASAYVARAAGYPNLITCDIGGTSTDVCLIKNAMPTMTSLADIGGFPNKTFQIEIKTIGAGGGSIAWADVGGELNIGPRSAGSTPGPACYGRGGMEPATTDAHLVVGHLDPAEPLGGEVMLDHGAAHAALARLGSSVGGLSAEEMALGVIQLAVVKMTSAIKEISVARGHDPRDFALLPFGGAGPMHATALAEELGITTILVPPVPGNLSALGFVTARARHDLVRAMLVSVDATSPGLIREAFALLDQDGASRLAAEGVTDLSLAELRRSVGMRIKGQSFDLQVPIPGPEITLDDLIGRFRVAYEARYAYLPAATGLEIVNFRLTALGPEPEIVLGDGADDMALEAGTCRLYTAQGWREARIVRREGLRPGDLVDGPAIVRESGATTVVGAGWQVRVDGLLNLVISHVA